MSGNEEESNPGRRSILAVLGTTALGTAGSVGYITGMLNGEDEDETSQPGSYDTETYNGERVDNWDEALPSDCSVTQDQKEWMIDTVDDYDSMQGDNFFGYVSEGKIRFEDSNSELHMKVDADYVDGEFIEDNDYNINNVC